MKDDGLQEINADYTRGFAASDLSAPMTAPSRDSEGLVKPRQYWATVAISFGSALVVLDGAIANVALPTIACELGVSNCAVTNVMIYQLMLVMVLLPFSTSAIGLGTGGFTGSATAYFFSLLPFACGRRASSPCWACAHRKSNVINRIGERNALHDRHLL